MPIREECCLCGKILPYYSLKRCFRCKRLYCSTCIEYAEDGNVVCLNCARRMVSPIRLGTKYSPLTRYLAWRARYTDVATLLFRQIEGIIGNSLPFVAFQNVEWWKNGHTGSQRKAWLDVGWHVEDVNVEKRMVTFRREKGIRPVEKKQKKSPRGQKKTQKLLPKAEPRRRRIPSRTKMAKMVGRLKNIERRGMMPKSYPGQLKSRSSHEKKLFQK